MTDTMIERVAQALAKESGVSDWGHVSEHGDYDSRDYWGRLARASVVAMMQPTQPVAHAGWMATRFAQPFCPIAISQAAWDAMIGAILEDAP